MKEVKSLQLKEEEGKEPTAAELKAEIDELRASIRPLVDGAGQPVGQAPTETPVQTILREAEEGRSPQQLKDAERWVLRQIGGRLQVQEGPKGVDGVGPPELIFDRYKVTPELRASGKTTLPDGVTVTHSVPVAVLARYYIEIILDEETYQSDAEKLLAIVESSRERGTHPTEFGFLFDAAGKLKPLKRRADRRRKKRI